MPQKSRLESLATWVLENYGEMILKFLFRDVIRMQDMKCWLCGHRNVVCGWNEGGIDVCTKCGIENIIPGKGKRGCFPPIRIPKDF